MWHITVYTYFLKQWHTAIQNFMCLVPSFGSLPPSKREQIAYRLLSGFFVIAVSQSTEVLSEHGRNVAINDCKELTFLKRCMRASLVRR